MGWLPTSAKVRTTQSCVCQVIFVILLTFRVFSFTTYD